MTNAPGGLAKCSAGLGSDCSTTFFSVPTCQSVLSQEAHQLHPLLLGVQSRDSTDRVAISASRQVKLGSSRRLLRKLGRRGRSWITEPISLDSSFPRPAGHSASHLAQGLQRKKLSYWVWHLCSSQGSGRAPSAAGASPAHAGCPNSFCSTGAGLGVAGLLVVAIGGLTHL